MDRLTTTERTSRTGIWLVIATICGLQMGCAAYQFGHGSLTVADIETIYVPVFDSFSFRPFLGEQLTEAVIKEIDQNTAYRVVPASDADSILTGTLVADAKQVVGEDGLDVPRAIQAIVHVQVQWVNRRGEQIRPPIHVPLSPAVLQIAQQSLLIPESGQSVATAHQEAFQQLAAEIVNQLEAPW